MNTRTFTARWLFPVAGPPIAGGTLTIAAGRVLAVDPPGVRPAEVDFGNAAILPGLVNAHTHLDLTGAAGLIPPRPDFVDWLRAVIRYRPSRPPEQTIADIRAGIQGSLRAGVTLVGDISAAGQSWDVLAEAPIRATVFLELLGLTAERAATASADAVAWWLHHRPTGRLRPALSPHAPYSCRAELLAAAARYDAPLAVHLAESPAEVELLQRHGGPFVPFLAELGAWEPGGLAWDFAHVAELVWDAPSLLLIHANYLPPDTPLPERATVVYCPRTHAAFGHSPHPFREFKRRGLRVALGTDSLASNPDLSVLEEARYLHRTCPDVAGDELLRMITKIGADALGWGGSGGRLIAGGAADFIVLPLPDHDPADPHDLLWRPGSVPSHVFIDGNRLAVEIMGE